MKKILIIEDDKEIAELERDYLAINGFSCDIETWGNTGLDTALSGDYDLFIIDIMLPGMDGFEIITRIREKKQTPVIFLSARSVLINGRSIPMTAKEFDLLHFLASNPNRAFSKEQLFDRIWGMDALGDISTVAVHIQRIRDKLSESGEKFIDTVWGVGYKLTK